ncbi:histidine phosphatase family protein [Nocardioides marmoriginsengisoli]|uniref:Histidine phosphatase family protein n=1 Tax=Nocardioides marmoriginsengisoli TaxID=661483 RepID=A0A3N0CRM6_9ACTN|nr:histidine phosphatase family protein [Nocardioides marmoriginsengisoli]RNL66098.1 histidine phosphatase family protein [Nocardioides marmoriginsengisoli]
MRLLLLRHGQTHGNTSGALDTAIPGLELTDLGRRQAEAAAFALAPEPIDAIFISPTHRTRQTAATLAAALNTTPVVLDGLREIAAGDYEMATDHDSILGYIGTVADWIEGRLDSRVSGAETGHEFLERYDAEIAEIAGRGHDVALVISHGAAIRTWVASRVHGSNVHAMAAEGLANTACIVLDGDPESGWTIVSWSSEPIGGEYLDDTRAPDPTGHATDEA